MQSTVTKNYKTPLRHIPSFDFLTRMKPYKAQARHRGRRREKRNASREDSLSDAQLLAGRPQTLKAGAGKTGSGRNREAQARHLPYR